MLIVFFQPNPCYSLSYCTESANTTEACFSLVLGRSILRKSASVFENILVQMGFQLGQGYYYGRPAPISKYDLEIESETGEVLRDYQDTESSAIFPSED